VQGKGGGLIQDNDDAMLKSELEEKQQAPWKKPKQSKVRFPLHLALELRIQEIQVLVLSCHCHHVVIMKDMDLLENRKFMHIKFGLCCYFIFLK
jgi:hypothetical protein